MDVARVPCARRFNIVLVACHFFWQRGGSDEVDDERRAALEAEHRRLKRKLADLKSRSADHGDGPPVSAADLAAYRHA